jgi:hypothetical protein
VKKGRAAVTRAPGPRLHAIFRLLRLLAKRYLAFLWQSMHFVGAFLAASFL